MKKYFLVICFTFYKIYAEQFIYPVADFDDGNQLMVLYQKSLEDIELWICNASNQHATKALSSFLIPANLRMIPSGKGFSFIDQGYIKIKEFAKRSARTLPIYEPIGFFSSMNWSDNETFYFVAREGDFFQIFQGDLQANIQRLTYGPADALYPQKIGSTLFYMKRDMNYQMSIIAKAWEPTPMITYQDASNVTVIQDSCQQLCFLRMISDHEGFYLQAPTKKTNETDAYEFACYHLIENENNWTTEKLFSFSIPSKYVTGSTRLYESIEPFLPNYTCKEFVYFVNWQHEFDQFKLCKFHIPTKTVEAICENSIHRNNHQQIFAPYIHQDKIHCGFILSDQPIKKSFQRKFEIQEGYFELPFFNIKNQS